MFCEKCGRNLPEGSQYCPDCGSPTAFPPAENMGKSFFASSKFLALAILTTIGAAVGIFGGTFEILTILTAIALWLIYSNAVSAAEPIKATGYKLLAVVLKIEYIFSWIGAGFMVIFGIIFAVVFSFFGSTLEYIFGSLIDLSVEVDPELSEMLNELALLLDDVSLIGPIFGIVLFVAFVLCAVLVVIFNIVFIKHFVKAAEKIAQGAKTGYVEAGLAAVEKSLSTRLLIMGIFQAVGALGYIGGNFLLFISMGILAAAYILASQIIKKQ